MYKCTEFLPEEAVTSLGTEGSPETLWILQIIISNTKVTIRPGTGLIWVRSATLSVRS